MEKAGDIDNLDYIRAYTPITDINGNAGLDGNWNIGKDIIPRFRSKEFNSFNINKLRCFTQSYVGYTTSDYTFLITHRITQFEFLFLSGLSNLGSISYDGNNATFTLDKTAGNNTYQDINSSYFPTGLYDIGGLKRVDISISSTLDGNFDNLTSIIGSSDIGKDLYFGNPEKIANQELTNDSDYSDYFSKVRGYTDNISPLYTVDLDNESYNYVAINEDRPPRFAINEKLRTNVLCGSKIRIEKEKILTPVISVDSKQLRIQSSVTSIPNHIFYYRIDNGAWKTITSTSATVNIPLENSEYYGLHSYYCYERYYNKGIKVNSTEVSWGNPNSVSEETQLAFADSAVWRVFETSDTRNITQINYSENPIISLYTLRSNTSVINTDFSEFKKRLDTIYVKIDDKKYCTKLEYVTSSDSSLPTPTVWTEVDISEINKFIIENNSKTVKNVFIRGLTNNFVNPSNDVYSINLLGLKIPNGPSTTRSDVDEITASWNYTDYPGDASDIGYEIYDSTDLNNPLGTTVGEVNTIKIGNLAPAFYKLRLKVIYKNPNNPYASEYNSTYSPLISTRSWQNLKKLEAPTLTSNDVIGPLYLVDQTNEGWEYITDDNGNRIPITKNGVAQNGVIEKVFTLSQSSFNSVEYYFYDKLGNLSPVEDPEGRVNTKSIPILNRGNYGYNGVHHIYGKLHYPNNPAYDSNNSNTLEYTIGSLKTPTPQWANTLTDPEGRILPDDYILLNDINLNKNYFNTDYKPTQNTIVEGSFKFENISESSYLLGCTDAGSNYGLTQNIGGSLLFNFGNASHTISSGFIANSKRSDIYHGRNISVEYRNTTTGIYPTDSYSFDELLTFTSTQPIYIGAYNYNGNILASTGSIKLEHLMIYENTDLKKNYFPAKRVSDNAIGLYDMISKTFIEISGSIAGSESDQYSKKYESRLVWDQITEDTDNVSVDRNDVFYYIDAIGNNGATVGSPSTVLQPENSSIRPGLFIPDTNIIYNMNHPLPTNYRIRVRAASYDSWYIGGSSPALINYEIKRPANVENFDWDPDNTTFSWNASLNANTYQIHEHPIQGDDILIQTIHDNKTSYYYPEIENGFHSFYCLALNVSEERN